MWRLFSYIGPIAAITGLLIVTVTCGAAAAQSLPDGNSCAPSQPSSAARVIKVTNGVWVAIGFSDANSVSIDGEDGSIAFHRTGSCCRS